MIWPFKRRQPVPFSEVISSKPDARCGDNPGHYLMLASGIACLRCKALDERAREERMAEQIADAVVRKLNRTGGPR